MASFFDGRMEATGTALKLNDGEPTYEFAEEVFALFELFWPDDVLKYEEDLTRNSKGLDHFAELNSRMTCFQFAAELMGVDSGALSLGIEYFVKHIQSDSKYYFDEESSIWLEYKKTFSRTWAVFLYKWYGRWLDAPKYKESEQKKNRKVVENPFVDLNKFHKEWEDTKVDSKKMEKIIRAIAKEPVRRPQTVMREDFNLTARTIHRLWEKLKTRQKTNGKTRCLVEGFVRNE